MVFIEFIIAYVLSLVAFALVVMGWQCIYPRPKLARRLIGAAIGIGSASLLIRGLTTAGLI